MTTLMYIPLLQTVWNT